MEKNEFFNPGHTYDVVLNNGATNGGAGGVKVGNKDIISKGTAHLYEQFALGTLTDFTYGDSTHASQLQNTFWYLEGEITSTSNTGDFLELAQDMFGTSVMDNYTGSAVQVMNLTKNGYRHQGQLFYMGVTYTGATLSLLALGLVGLAAARRRIRK